MDLTDEQKSALGSWINEGLTLSEIQGRLDSKFGIRMTYMDLRFLIDDLNLEIKAEAPHFEEHKVEELGAEKQKTGSVSVSLDKVARPDALVSGSVTFSDGMTAQWHLDQMGRLALNPKQPGYKPSEADLQSFQDELRSAVEKSGMF